MNNPVDPEAITTDSHSSARTAERVATKAHEYIDRIAAQALAAEEQIRTTYGNADGRVHASSDQVKARYSEINSTVRTYVNEHPLTSIGVAFGAGVLLAALLRK